MAEPNMMRRLRNGLRKTHSRLFAGFDWTRKDGERLDDAQLEQLEELLLGADVGVAATEHIVGHIRGTRGVPPYRALRDVAREILEPVARPLEITAARPFMILMVGVNGVGKTTTIGKLAMRFREQGLDVMLAAGDTFRAAAVEQLQRWGERNQVAVVAQGANADPAAVIYDALSSAAARNIDVLLADTAGRLHTQDNLMGELQKIVRVAGKVDATAPHEKLLVLDAGIGQNALSQAAMFDDAIGLTGIALTKLDGSARGGIVFALAEQLRLPIRYIGIGEAVEDLRPFEPDAFLDALLADGEQTAV